MGSIWMVINQTLHFWMHPFHNLNDKDNDPWIEEKAMQCQDIEVKKASSSFKIVG